jgi:hypothetical protein
MNFAIDCVVQLLVFKGKSAQTSDRRSTVLGQNFCAFPQPRLQVPGEYLKSGHGRSLPHTFEFIDKFIIWRYISYICWEVQYINDRKLKVNFALEHVTKAQKALWYSSTVYLTSTLGGSALSTPRPGHFTPGKEIRYPLKIKDKNKY